MSIIHRKKVIRLNAVARTPKLLKQLGVAPEDIVKGQFWGMNSDRLQYLFDRAEEGYRNLMKELHPDRNPQNAEQCVKLTAIWRILKKQFAQHGIPNFPAPKERTKRLWHKGAPKPPTIIWPNNVPPNLSGAELAVFLNCKVCTAYWRASQNGYAFRAKEEDKI